MHWGSFIWGVVATVVFGALVAGLIAWFGSEGGFGD